MSLEYLKKENREKYQRIEEAYPMALESWSTEDWKQEVDKITTTSYQQAAKDAMEIAEGLRKLYMTRDTDFSNEHGTNVADVYNQALDDTKESLSALLNQPNHE